MHCSIFFICLYIVRYCYIYMFSLCAYIVIYVTPCHMFTCVSYIVLSFICASYRFLTYSIIIYIHIYVCVIYCSIVFHGKVWCQWYGEHRVKISFSYCSINMSLKTKESNPMNQLRKNNKQLINIYMLIGYVFAKQLGLDSKVTSWGLTNRIPRRCLRIYSSYEVYRSRSSQNSTTLIL